MKGLAYQKIVLENMVKGKYNMNDYDKKLKCCINCIYFRSLLGICIRFPKEEDKKPIDYCGEFKFKYVLINE